LYLLALKVFSTIQVSPIFQSSPKDIAYCIHHRYTTVSL
jgi:hypothetical protein